MCQNSTILWPDFARRAAASFKTARADDDLVISGCWVLGVGCLVLVLSVPGAKLMNCVRRPDVNKTTLQLSS